MLKFVLEKKSFEFFKACGIMYIRIHTHKHIFYTLNNKFILHIG